MSTARRLLRPLVGAAVLVVLVWRLGTAPFLDALDRIDGWSLAVAAAVTALTTACCAWRWRLVARGLGVAVSFPAALAAYYRSQFLNTTLPGGVVGDVHRGVSHGRDVGDVGRSLRSVLWERSAGQAVTVVVSVAILLLLPSPVRSSLPVVATVAAAGLVVVVSVGRRLSLRGRSRAARLVRGAGEDLRIGVLNRRAWPGVTVASVLALAGHTAIFLLAARVAGVTGSALLIPLALVVLLASALPLNIAGWGPREGMAAWAFGSAGLGAATGVSVATVYGVLVLVSSLPGLLVLVAGWLHRPATLTTAGGPRG